jgi:multidrug efflux system outer membrane protein
VLIAQRNLFEAELALTGTHRLHLVSIVQLYKALGGGWAPTGVLQEQPAYPQAVSDQG